VINKQQKHFLRKLLKNNIISSKVNIDKNGSNSGALLSINKSLPKSSKIKVRQNKYMNNIIVILY
jgi:transposase-like protein